MCYLRIYLLLGLLLACQNQASLDKQEGAFFGNKNAPSDSLSKPGIRNPSRTVLKDTILNDTSFISRTTGADAYYQAVFLDVDKESGQSAKLLNFSFGEFYGKIYKNLRERLEKPGPLRAPTWPDYDLPHYWLPLYQYKGQLYLYAPCDLAKAGKIIIRKDEYIYWIMMGPHPMRIFSVSKPAPHVYQLIRGSLTEANHACDTTRIHIIDPLTKLAVFEQLHWGGEQKQYRLYIPLQSAAHYDLAVNYCPRQKVIEYPFEPIDFEALLAFEKLSEESPK